MKPWFRHNRSEEIEKNRYQHVARPFKKGTEEHPEELTYRCYLSVLAGFDKYLPFPVPNDIVAERRYIVKIRLFQMIIMLGYLKKILFAKRSLFSCGIRMKRYNNTCRHCGNVDEFVDSASQFHESM